MSSFVVHCGAVEQLQLKRKHDVFGYCLMHMIDYSWMLALTVSVTVAVYWWGTDWTGLTGSSQHPHFLSSPLPPSHLISSELCNLTASSPHHSNNE